MNEITILKIKYLDVGSLDMQLMCLEPHIPDTDDSNLNLIKTENE